MTELITRRRALFSAAALATASMLAEPLTQAQSTPTSPMLHMVDSSSAEFASIIAKAYPTLQNDPVFEKLQPLCHLLQNRWTVSVRSLALRWSVSTGQSVFSRPLYLQVPPQHFSAYSGERMLMGPNGYLLVSPFFAWHPGAAPVPPVDWKSILSGTATRRFTAEQIASSVVTGLQYRGIIYSDGATLGPSTKGVVLHTKLTQNGEHDCALSISKKLKQGATLTTIGSVLKQYVSWHPNSLPDKQQRIYQEARRNYAQFLLNTLTAEPSKFTQVVASAVNQKKLQFLTTTAA